MGWEWAAVKANSSKWKPCKQRQGGVPRKCEELRAEKKLICFILSRNGLLKIFQRPNFRGLFQTKVNLRSVYFPNPTKSSNKAI